MLKVAVLRYCLLPQVMPALQFWQQVQLGDVHSECPTAIMAPADLVSQPWSTSQFNHQFSVDSHVVVARLLSNLACLSAREDMPPSALSLPIFGRPQSWAKST